MVSMSICFLMGCPGLFFRAISTSSETTVQRYDSLVFSSPSSTLILRFPERNLFGIGCRGPFRTPYKGRLFHTAALAGKRDPEPARSVLEAIFVSGAESSPRSRNLEGLFFGQSHLKLLRADLVHDHQRTPGFEAGAATLSPAQSWGNIYPVKTA